MVPFYVKNHLNRHLLRHLVSSKLPKDARVSPHGFVMYYISSFKKCKNIFYRRYCRLWVIFHVSMPDYKSQSGITCVRFVTNFAERLCLECLSKEIGISCKNLLLDRYKTNMFKLKLEYL